MSLSGVPIVAGAVIAAALCALSAPAAPGGPRAFQTARTFDLAADRTTRTFTFRERSGVILLNRLIVPHGVRAYVDARIPHVAGARVESGTRSHAALSCRRKGAVDVCTQGEEWCPMPKAVWHFRLVKLGGPPGPIRFDFVVAPPPSGS